MRPTSTPATTLRVTPAELRRLVAQLDALIRPLIAARRETAAVDAELVHLGLTAFPLTGAGWGGSRP